MINFDIDAVIELLEQANNHGLKISYDENEISVKVPKDKKIDALLLEQLRTKKEMLVEYFTKYKAESRDDNFKTLQKIDRSGYNNKFPLSFAQERLWFIHQLQGSRAYHMPWEFRLTGTIDKTALHLSFATLLQRHEILRTVIIDEQGVGYQKVQDAVNWQLNFLTIKEIAETGETLKTFIENQAQRPFDLAKDEMIRVTVIKISETEHLLAIVLHHIAFDGWSLPVMVSELKELYNSYIQNRKPLLAPAHLQYIDYALWLRQYLGQDLLNKKLDYWKRKLEGVSPIALPVNYPRPLQQSTRGGEVFRTMPVQAKAQLMQIASANGCTLFMTMLAAFKVLLFRYSEQNDICVGSPVAGRQHEELEKQIGYFVNTLVLRSHINGVQSFPDFLQQVRQTTLDAYSHQDTPFEKIVEALGQERDVSRNPLFQIMFVLENNPSASDVAFEGLQLELIDKAIETAKFDLNLTVSISEQGLHLRLSYCTDLFTADFVEKMLQHYENLLISVCSNTSLPINRLVIMKQAEMDDIQLLLKDRGQLRSRTILPGTESEIRTKKQYVNPAGKYEIALVKIWEELLNRKNISINDNFFALGGHSLLVTRVVAAVRKELNRELHIKDIFLYPEIVSLAAYIEDNGESKSLPSITQQPRPSYIPLSFAQERLWFIDKLQGGTGYLMPWQIRIKGDLNIAAIEQAFKEIITRHEVLRTVVKENNGEGYQYILAPGQWKLNYTGMEDGFDISAFLRKELSTPFDLSADWMLKAHLIKVAAQEHLLMILIHHIACDGWSVPVLITELKRLYVSFCNRQPSPLPELSLQYADYALWQHKYINGDVLKKQLGYWKKQLAGIVPLILPADFTRTAEVSTRGQNMSYLLDTALCEKLRSFSKIQGATLYMTLLSAFKVLLYKYTAQNDICVGISLANRTQKDIEQLVGFFVNALAIRSTVDGEQTFLSLLHNVKATLLDAYDNQDIPFEKVVEAAGIKRDMSASPLFPVMFVLQNTPVNEDEAELPGLEFFEETASHNSSKFEITFSLRENERGINVHVEYCSDLFAKTTIERMIGHYETILEAIVSHPDLKIGLLPILKTAEKLQILKEFTNTAVPYSLDKTVIDLFQEQALAVPENIAMIFEGHQFTYAVLQEKSDRFANFLRYKGVKAEVMVPVCLKRTPEMIIAILGILKAGGAFVPVNPDFPAARIQYILKDTAAAVIVIDDSCKDYVDWQGAEVVDITGDWQKNSFTTSEPVDNRLDPQQLAYVIYTSGSTGKPKGVLIAHRSLLNYLLNCKKKYVNERTAAGSYAHLSYTFDAALTAVFLPLICGKPVVIMPEDTSTDEIFNNDDFKNRLGFDFLKLTPSHLSLLSLTTSAEDIKRLNKLILGGEALHGSHFKFLTNKGVNTTIINEYGPTEATVGCCIYSVASNATGQMGPIPIGKPLDNVTMYVLDQYHNPVPLGITGEICIGGVQVARGYLNLPELTEEKFIADPFSGTGKLYKTGDAGRWLASGNMEYIGRLDDQVKLRGHRIEPGEVENIINQLEQVENSAVIMVKDPDHSDKLTAYYTPQKDVFRITEKSLYQNRIEKWKEIYETTYADDKDAEVPAAENEEFNIAGWNDSFTGGMIEEAQMREWQSDIISLILADQATHVLEFGVGMGLIYFQLADKVKHYTGIDLSASAIYHLQHIISKNPEKYCSTYFKACPAHEFMTENDHYTDTVIINSVCQYFPGQEYLTTLIGRSLAHLKGTGRIIIGDVRDHRLTRLFKCRLVSRRINEPVHIDEFDWMVSQEVIKEEELCFSPDYFYNLKSQFPEITHVDIQLKKGQYSNEMTLYRYNVVLYAGIQKEIAEPVWKDWTAALAEITEGSLLQQNASVIAIKDIPNPRLWREKIFDECLLNRSVATTREIAEKINRAVPDENEIHRLITRAEANGYHCRLLINQDKLMCSLLLEKDPSANFIQHLYEAVETSQDGIVSAPLFSEIAAQWQILLKKKLQEQLPDYMIPANFILVGHFPLTSHKKVDKAFLGKLKSGRIFSNTKNIAAVTITERKVLSLWQQLFGTEAIGVTDNFFELGGHSIMMVQLLFHLSEESISLKDLFLYQNVRAQAAYIDKKSAHTLLPLKKQLMLNSHLLLLKQGNAQRPLFIVPGSTGVSDSYDKLAGCINAGCQVLGIQMKGSLPGEKPLKNLSELAAQHIAWMREVQPAGPYRIVGHSFGGYVVYEMARQLEAEGDTIELLAIIDVDAVSTKLIPETEEDKIGLIMFIAGGVFEKYDLVKKPYPGWVYEIKAQLSGLQTVENIKNKLLDCLMDKFISRKNEIEFLLQLLDLHITNALMNRQIIPAKLKAHLLLVRGKDEDWSGLNDELGWDVRFNGVTVFSVPGTHASMMEESSQAIGSYFSEKLLLI